MLARDTWRLRTVRIGRWSARGGHSLGSTSHIVIRLLGMSLHHTLSGRVQLPVVVL